MRTRAALLVCLMPSVALAQTLTPVERSDTNNGGRNDLMINKVECAGTVSDSVYFSISGFTAQAAGTTFSLYSSSTTTCPPTGTSGWKLLVDNIDASTGTTQTTPFFTVANEVLQPAGITCPTNTTSTVYFCLTLKAGATENLAATNSMDIDGTTPPVPVLTSVEPGDGALNIHWQAGTGGVTSASYVALTTAQQDPADAHLSPETNNNNYRQSGLTNGVAYDVAVQAYTASGNPSGYSDTGSTSLCQVAPAACTPVPVDDFWAHYLKSGGREQGGCGGSAGALALLALLPVLPRLRRRRP